MRRKDREITDSSIISEFIRKEQILRIAFYDEG
ncbi:MAG: pyridoxamine 5'-phosphate oxidase family protein, partial [Ruminococcaceae bacterium]|nr:pyridoxamine 5'-phosphate oxidase family protein [Oscillospiraceae bacterium]